MSKPVPHPEFASSFGAQSPFDQVLIDKFAPRTASLTFIQFGSVVIVGVPGEPTSDVGRKIQEIGRASGYPHFVVISHCNGWIGYILEPEDYDRGGYEATLSFHGRETATRIFEAIERAVSKLIKTSVAPSKRGN